MRSFTGTTKLRLPGWLGTVSVLLASALVGIASDCRSPSRPGIPASAYLPELAGYDSRDVPGSVLEALQAAGVNLGDLGTFGVVLTRFEDVANCLRDRGVVDIRLYVNSSVASDLGVIGVVNRTAFTGNALLCTFDALFIDGGCAVCSGSIVQPCAEDGSFEADGDTLIFGYTGVTAAFCSAARAHFERCPDCA